MARLDRAISFNTVERVMARSSRAMTGTMQSALRSNFF
jgi:hypothetical protein